MVQPGPGIEHQAQDQDNLPRAGEVVVDGWDWHRSSLAIRHASSVATGRICARCISLG
jgi:hypothetical protein